MEIKSSNCQDGNFGIVFIFLGVLLLLFQENIKFWTQHPSPHFFGLSLFFGNFFHIDFAVAEKKMIKDVVPQLTIHQNNPTMISLIFCKSEYIGHEQLRKVISEQTDFSFFWTLDWKSVRQSFLSISKASWIPRSFLLSSFISSQNDASKPLVGQILPQIQKKTRTFLRLSKLGSRQKVFQFEWWVGSGGA